MDTSAFQPAMTSPLIAPCFGVTPVNPAEPTMSTPFWRSHMVTLSTAVVGLDSCTLKWKSYTPAYVTVIAEPPTTDTPLVKSVCPICTVPIVVVLASVCVV